MKTIFYAESEQKDRCGIDSPVASHSYHTAWDFSTRKITTLLMFIVFWGFLFLFFLQFLLQQYRRISKEGMILTTLPREESYYQGFIRLGCDMRESYTASWELVIEEVSRRKLRVKPRPHWREKCSLNKLSQKKWKKHYENLWDI